MSPITKVRSQKFLIFAFHWRETDNFRIIRKCVGACVLIKRLSFFLSVKNAKTINKYLNLTGFWKTYHVEQSERLKKAMRTRHLERSERPKETWWAYRLERSERLRISCPSNTSSKGMFLYLERYRPQRYSGILRKSFGIFSNISEFSDYKIMKLKDDFDFQI